MDMQIKRTVKAGNSSAVILPRAWLNKQVRVEVIQKTPEIILTETLGILKKHLDLDSIIGVYLVGSYARDEQEDSSDIDILVITDEIDKNIIHEGIYNILTISQSLLYQKLDRDLFPIGQMIKEAKPLLNKDYLKKLEIKITKKNVKWYLDTTQEKIEIIKDYLKNCKTKNRKLIEDRIGYTLILRIRTLEIIRKLMQDKSYSNKEFIKLIEKISNTRNSYERYLVIKNNPDKDNKKLDIEEAQALYNYLKQDLVKIKKIVNEKAK